MDAAVALGLGFALGARHAVDPDHVAAVAQLLGQRLSLRRAMWTAAVWGFGHSATLLTVGGSLVLLGLTLPADLERAAQLLVAAMLIALALPRPRLVPSTAWRPLAVGLVHGLAGSGTLSLLAMAALPSKPSAVAYLVVSCAGMVLTMVVVTAVLARTLRHRGPRTLAAFSLGARLVAVVVALLIIAAPLLGETAP